ncbi:MAG: ATP-dependent DNA helicase RecG [Microlunatus sp.]|nr:ATP-dependent DNA helicase RecG [Microlunatus sp.]MDN5803362.1 ATP-dependent DNA helicase RecG [Microlunatus sp.]
MTPHLRLVPDLPEPRPKKLAKRPSAKKAAERPPAQFWRTTGFTRLAVPLAGVLGGKTAKAFEALKVKTVGDLMLHLPRRYVSGTELSDLRNLTEGEEVTVLAQVRHASVHAMNSGRGAGKFRLQAVITDGPGTLNLTFFGARHLVDYWQAQLRPGARGIFAGKVGAFQGQPQLTHPDFVIIDEHGNVIGGAQRNVDLGKVAGASGRIGLYPATAKLRTWTIANCVSLTLDSLTGMEDPLPEWVRRQADLIDQQTAYRSVHRPDTEADVVAGLARIQFDEAFGLQLAMARRRAVTSTVGAVPRPRVDGGLLDAFDARLPFELTEGQREIGDQLFADLARPHPMQRLLQGEVGSGKTVVALRAMLTVVDNGGQTALLAPTEVLAAQHHRTITGMLGDLVGADLLTSGGIGTGVTLVTGSLSAGRRREASLAVASGAAGIVIGTHALLTSGTQFADLGLVVVDEQHRFGVEQRAALVAKAAQRPHTLVMTATPIPRTVAMTVFGDLETSTLTQVPAGRAEVSTVVVDYQSHPSWLARTWQRVIEEVAEGRQAYVVCPRISDGSADDDAGAAVEDVYAQLTEGPLRGLRVAMLHGRLAADEKDEVMGRFVAGTIDVLIATTVIEVGVDVANAAAMVICDADRFGISQLHQLRGRIGRGAHPGVCLLLTSTPPGTPAAERLAAVARTRDGFRLAKVDLEQRREGDVLGADQSGIRSGLRHLRVLEDEDLILFARDLATACLESDPDLADPGLADIVDSVELRAAGDWLERS